MGRLLMPAMASALASVLAIRVIIEVIVALDRDRLDELAGIVVGAVILHNVLGLAGGYWAARLFGSLLAHPPSIPLLQPVAQRPLESVFPPA